MSKLLEYAGKRYVSVEALRAACQDPAFVAEAAVMLKVGYERGDSGARVISIMLASFAAVAAGEIPRPAMAPEERARILASLDKPLGVKLAGDN